MLAREMAAFFRSPLAVERGDAHYLERWYGKFDVVYSLGVVEHFDPSVTSQLIAEQARCAATVVTAVPTKHTRYSGPVTDERLYSRAQFARLVRDAGLDVKESFVYGSLPTWTARQLGRTAPKLLNRALQHLFTYGMGICVVGRKPGTRVGIVSKSSLPSGRSTLAERNASSWELASRLDRARFEAVVCVLGEEVPLEQGALAATLHERGVKVDHLGFRGFRTRSRLHVVAVARTILRLWAIMRRERPLIFHGVLFWAYVTGTVIAAAARVPVVVASRRSL